MSTFCLTEKTKKQQPKNGNTTDITLPTDGVTFLLDSKVEAVKVRGTTAEIQKRSVDLLESKTA